MTTNRPHYFCHISLMLLSTAALSAPVATPPTAAPQADVAPAGTPELPTA